MKLDQKATRLELPARKLDAIYFDDDLDGFGIRLPASGDRVRRTWIAQYRAHNRTRRMRIGAAETLNADEARKAARKVLAKVTLGGDPQGDKVTARLASVHSLKSIAEKFLEVQEAKLRPASYRVTKLYLLGPYFKPLHSTTITEIRLADVAACLTAITRNNGSVTATGRARSAPLDSRIAGQVAEWRLHDLRRTAATRMADIGVQPHIIEAALNHYGGHRRGVAGVYNRSPYERELKAALALWADYVQSIVDGTERKIVPFPQS